MFLINNFIRPFLAKQSDKGLGGILQEIIIRAISLMLFPALYLLLMICSCIYPIKIGFLYRERLGHLALNTDLYLRRRYLSGYVRNEIHIFFVYRPANMQLVKMFSRKMCIVNSEYLAKIFAPIGFLRTRFLVPLPFMGNEYFEFNNAPQQISFNEYEKKKGEAFLSEIGIPREQWYVCIFARDHNYYRVYSKNTDRRFSDHRNADIDSYHLAITSIIKSGGWVIRMGSAVEKPLSYDHPKVIDYASKYRNDFLDIYLTAHAKFFLGTTSGASDLAVLFNTPFVGINYVPIGCAPFGKNAIFIPKRVVRITDGTDVSQKKLLEIFTGIQMSSAIIPEEILITKGWQFKNNTPEEIRDLVEEMLQRLDNTFIHSDEYQAALYKFRKMLPVGNIYKSNMSPMGSKMLLSLDLS
jgi:putative glycosyltransferase (TIGR04372 family)